MPVDIVSTASTATVNPSVDLSPVEEPNESRSQSSTDDVSIGSIGSMIAALFPVVAPFAGAIDWAVKHIFGFFKRVSG